jgi:hypothetical protein
MLTLRSATVEYIASKPALPSAAWADFHSNGGTTGRVLESSLFRKRPAKTWYAAADNAFQLA